MTEKKRDQTLDAVKGVAIVLVMLGHVLNLNHIEDAYLYDGIRAVQMPLFMMVSGCLCGMGRRVSDFSAYRKVLKKRAVSYLVPFFAWIAVIYPLELPGAFADTLFHLDYGLWFLMTLFLITAMVYTAQLASGFIKENPVFREIVFWLVFGLLFAFVVLETLLGWEFLSPALTRLYSPFYMAGYVAAVYSFKKILTVCPGINEKEQTVRKIWNIVKFLLALGAGAVFLYLVIFYDLVDVSTPQALLRQIAASFTGCYLIFWLCRRWPGGRAKGAAAWLGNYTLEIYVLHFHFATLLNRGVSYELYSLQGLLFVLVSFAVMSILTAAIIFVTKKIWVLDFLLYGKKPRKNKIEIKAEER